MPIKPEDKTHMPMLDPVERRRLFHEVNRGYDAPRARFEALRCLECQEPACETGCPVLVPIRKMARLIAEGQFEDALRAVKEVNSLPAVCGRVCPQETQCEEVCHLGKRFRPVGIGFLERFLADWEIENGRIHEELPEPRPEKVAIVGSGPAGLTAAGDLARLGYGVKIFEALHQPGGVLRYGIPEFRLPNSILDFEIDGSRRLGVEIVCNVVVGRTVTLDELLEEYAAVFLGTGAGLPSFLRIPGENLTGVYSSNEFLTRVNLMQGYRFPEYDTPVRAGRRTVVVGAGNVAMDSVRSALRLGAEEAIIVYRRTIKEMTARVEEYEHAVEEGVEFNWLTTPVRVFGDERGWVKAIELEKMKLGEPDASGRARPVPTGEIFTMECDAFVVAIGTSPNPLIAAANPELKTESWGGLIVNEETGETSKDRVYAAGDIVTGSATVIEAAGGGKQVRGSRFTRGFRESDDGRGSTGGEGDRFRVRQGSLCPDLGSPGRARGVQLPAGGEPGRDRARDGGSDRVGLRRGDLLPGLLVQAAGAASRHRVHGHGLPRERGLQSAHGGRGKAGRLPRRDHSRQALHPGDGELPGLLRRGAADGRRRRVPRRDDPEASGSGA